ncbi:MAG: hypothetical protein GY928_14585 [Colwellia sp.]|nr:hypothetical protein [Colwellia sp.]
MKNERIKVGRWSFEQSSAGAGYHLYENVDIEITKDGKRTGEFRQEDKLFGYDVSMKRIINVISEDEAFCEEVKLSALLQRIEKKVDEVSERIINELKK